MAKVLFNSQGIIETPTLLLQHKNFETIGNGGVTNVSGLTYKSNFNDANEVSFKIHKFNNEKKHPLWDSMVDFKIIYIPQLHERFEISVTSEEDPNDVSKSITGTSLCEAELSQITLRNVQINTETDMTNPLYDENFPTILYRDPEEYDSVENLAIWEKSKYDYLKDKTAYPTEESVIVRKKSILKHASLLHRVLEKAPHYSILYVADTLKKLKTVHEFTFDGTDILSALKDTIADDFHCVFIFDSENRTISVLDLYSTCNNCGYRGDYMDECPECGSNNITNKYGEDTNILINSTNLTTQITLDSNSDSLKNCFYITGADDAINAAIANVNPNGTQYIYFFSNDTLADMPTELQSKLRSYNALYDEINKTREYNLVADKVAGYNNVINYINTKFSSMSEDDQDKIEYPTLTSPLIGYPSVTSAWYSAMDVYYFLNDSMMPVIDVDGMGLDDSITAIQDGLKDLGGVAVTGIKTITQSAVKGSVDALVKTFFSASYYDMNITDSSLSDYDSSTGKRTWSGTITLTSHSQMDENNQYLTKSVKITTDVIESTEKYIEQKITRMTNRADEIKDKQITSIKLAEDKFKEQLGYYSLVELNNLKKEFEACRDIAVDGFTDESVDVQYNNSELKDKYVNFYSGRIVDIQDEIKTRESQIEAVNAVYNTEKSTGEIQDIVNSVKTELDLENYLGEELYTLWYSYRREDDYSNDNYSSTGLDDVTLIKRATELVEAAKRELYKAGNLQYSLSATMGNLLTLDEFKPIKDKFEVGNFIKVGIDDKVYSLRLMSYETDFDSIQDMPVEFSTVEKVYTGYSDVQSVLDASRSMATSYSSVKNQADKSKKTTDTVNDWSDNGINGDNTQFINSSEQTILINKNGVLGRSYDDQLDEFSLKQFKLVNNGMYFTKDGWQSIETGIGRFTYRDINGNLVEDYGIIAKTVVGNLIIGKELQIYNEDKSIVIDENGLTIDGGYLKIKGTEVGSDGKTISEVIIDLDTAQKLVALAQQAADRAQESADKAQASADKANKATEDLKVETNEIRELAEKGVDHVTTYFYQSDSATELVGGEWITNSVTWISGKYVWQKVITYYKDGTDNSQTAKAICISGANGQDGKPGENGIKGKGVKSITPQYAISDSNVLQPNEGWSDKEPEWSEGKYIWTRTLVVYDDNTQETTTPIVSNGLNSALSISTAARKQADSAKSTADSANTTASEAKSTADSASQTANKASENATSAVNKANTANTNASSALTTATSANKTANDASSKADNATKTANSASEKADTANTNASSAVDISNSAKGIANSAKSVADTAKGLVDDVKTDLSTNYSTTEIINDKIDKKAETITTSITKTVSETYETKSDSSQKLTDAKSYADGVGSNTLSSANETAKGYADKAESNANTNTANQLKSYAKTTDMKVEIEKSANGIKQTVAETYVSNATYETDLSNIQGQIDGNIQTWSGTDVPTLKNEPASTWSDDEKVTHIGDIYYDDNNHAYRFRVDNGVYSWQILTDTDVTKALSDSADAISKANATEKKLLTDYKTWSDTSSEIEQTKNGILQTVKDTYAESATVTDLSNNLKTNYSTTKDMNSAIKEKADEITLAVSETYSTKKTVEENLATSKSYADSVGSKTLESAKTDATSKANQAKSDAIADTDKKLTSYSTTEQMKSAIKTSADSITSTVSKTYSTKEEVANIQVGGRNLLRQSSLIGEQLICNSITTMNSVTLRQYEEEGYHIITPSEGNQNNGIGFMYNDFTSLNIKQGDTITFSCDIKGTSDLHKPNIIIRFQANNGNWYGANVISSNPVYFTPSNDNWKRISVTYTIPSDEWTSKAMWLAIHGNYESNLYVRNLKLEKGNKATDWTPAPEDVDSDISTAKADAISKANASTDEKLKSYETIENVDSKISQSATNITSTIKKTYETIDNVNKVRTSVTEAETKAQQSLDQFLWLVKSGSSSTSLTLTDSAVTAITKQFTVKSPDGSATIIEGGKLKTDALKSNNYVAGNDGTYSAFGTFLDLSNGEIHTPGFYLDSVGNAFYQGTVNADAGYFGDANNNWYIGSAEFDNIRNKDDALVNGVEYSALISKGNAALTAGHWYLMSQDGSLGIQSGWTTINGGNYVLDKETQKYYDMGMVEPIFGSKNEWDNKFLYIRRVKDPSSSQSTWEYLFKVDKDGTIYENGTKLSDKYARKDAVGSTYLPLTGGIVTGNLTVNGTLTATASKANQLTHTLSVNGKSWNGSADLTVGTMGVAYGGTGKSSWTANGIIYASASGTLSQLSLGTAGYILQSGGTSAPSWVNPSTLNVASATKATQDGNGNTISDTYLRKDFDSVSQNVSFGGSVDVDDLTAGTLLVSGVARFANGLIGNLKGTASNVPWSGITDKPKTFAPSAHTHTMANISDWETYVYSAQGTRTKNTVLAAPNGSDGKATFRTLVEADIPALSKSKVGLNNVDNTADSAKNVLSASKLTTARNINGVAFDGTNNITITANPTANQLTNEDLNNIKTPGEYWASGSNSVTNKPSGVDAFSLQVLRSAGGWYEQVIIGSNLLSGKIYQRRWNNTAWTSWTYIYSELFKPSKSDVGLDKVDNIADVDKSVLSATKLVTARNITVGSAKKSFDGTADISFSLADIGASASGHTHNYASKVTLAGTDYSCVSNAITITKANLQTAIGSTGLGLMTEAERSKLNSIKVSSGGTIDFSGVTASGVLTATIGKDKTVTLTHNTSGVKAGTYKSVTVDTYGHVTAGTNPTTLSGYGITDALSSSTKYAASDSIGGNALRANHSNHLANNSSTNSADEGGLYWFNIDGKAGAVTDTNDTPTTAWWYILRNRHTNTTNDYYTDVAIPFNNTGIYYKTVNAGVVRYNRWVQVLDDLNYTDYVPKKDGTGASGTWGIDITGSATNATNDSNGKKISDTYLPLSGGTLTGTLNILGGDRRGYSEGIRMHVSSLGWTAMVLCGSDNTGNTGTSAKTWGVYNHDGLFYISKNGSTTETAQLSCVDDNVWRANGNILLHAGNYKSYVPTLTGTGASGIWDISITGNAKTATSADSATKATQDSDGNSINSTYLKLIGGSMTGTITTSASQILKWTHSTTDNNDTGCSWYGIGTYKTSDGYHWLNISNYWGINFTTKNSDSFTHNGNTIITSANIGLQSVSSATKATQDGAGNVITSKYVTIDTTQTISGSKTFSKETTISSATASTNKTTGALKVKGGIASEGQISADKVMIGDKCTLEYDANLQCLNFVFA